MIKFNLNNADATTAAMLRDLATLGQGAGRAAATAINTTLKTLRKIAVRQLQERYTVKSGDLTSRAAVQRASSKSLLGRLTFTGRRGLGLINFQARPNRPGPSRPKDGASVKVLRQGSRKNPRKDGQKAFAVTYRSGHTHLAVRQGDKLRTLYGPHPLAALKEAGAQLELDRAAQQEFHRNLLAQIDRLLAKGGSR